MKLILASQGFTTPEIAKATADLAGKDLQNLNIAIINEAYVANSPGFDQQRLLYELGLIEEHVKGTVAFVNLWAYSLTEYSAPFRPGRPPEAHRGIADALAQR